MFARPLVLTLLLFVAAAIAYLAGNGSAPLFDRDEPRYALTSQNMLRTGDLVVPRQYDKPRTAKPPMIYWVQSAAMKLFGGATGFAARFPSALAMLAVVALLTIFLSCETDPATRLIATAVFAFSGLTLFLAKAAITDATLLLFTSLSMFSVYRAWRGDRSWPIVITYALSTGLALLAKGPVVLGLQLTTLAALLLLSLLDRKFPATANWKTFPYPPAAAPTSAIRHPTSDILTKSLVAAAIALAVALPWVILVEHRSPGFLTAAFRHDLVDRATRGVDGQARPPGFYFVVLYGTFFPWSLLLPATFVIAWRNRHRPLTRFCFAACIGPWLMFESVTSKMPHWFMPVFLPLSVLTAEAVVRCWRNAEQDLRNNAFRATIYIWTTAVLALAVLPWFFLRKLDLPIWCVALLTLWSLTVGPGGAYFFLRAKFPQAIALLSAGMATLITLAYAVIIPRMPSLMLGKTTGQALRAAMPTPDAKVIMDDSYNEPSIAFYQGGTAREADIKTLGDPLFRTDIDVLSCTEAAFNAHADEAQSRWRIRSSFKGLLYAKSAKPVRVLVLTPAR